MVTCLSVNAQETSTPVAAATTAKADDRVEEIVVTGTLLRSNRELVSTAIYTAENFINEGAPSVGQILFHNPVMAGMTNQDDQGRNQGTLLGTISPNIRGLNRTLVLFNGKRLANAGASITGAPVYDLNFFPQIALQRLDTLKSGGSTLYGSDAIAGTVNYVTRSDFTGLELQADYDYYSGGGERRFALIAGVGGDSVHWVTSLEYGEVERLTVGERNYRDWTNPATGGFNSGFSSTSNPGTYFSSATRANPIPDPACGSSGVWDSKVVSWVSPGNVCQWTFMPATNAVDPKERYRLLSQFEADITPHARLYGWAAASGTKQLSAGVPSYPAGQLGATDSGGLFFIPDDNPGYATWFAQLSPAQQATYGNVAYRGMEGIWSAHRMNALLGPNENVDVERRWQMYVFGSRGDLPVGGVSYDVSGSFQERTTGLSVHDQWSQRYLLALHGLGGPSCARATDDPYDPLNAPFRNNANAQCFGFNPFGTAITAAAGSALQNSAALTNWLDAYPGYTDRSRLVVWDATFSGKLDWRLPGGKLEWVLGLQQLSQTDRLVYGVQGFDYPPRVSPLQSSGVVAPGTVDRGLQRRSVFAEMSLPITDALVGQVAARYEDYGIDSNLAPKFSFNWALADWLSLRAGYEQPYAAPQVTATLQTLVQFTAVGINNVLTQYIVPGSNLKPEKSDNYDLGITLRPLPSLAVELSYYRYDIEGLFSTQALANSELLHDAQGNVIGAISRTINGPGIKTTGLDLNATYSVDLLGGELGLDLGATYVDTYDIELAATPTRSAYTYSAAGYYNFGSSGAGGATIDVTSLPRVRANLGANFAIAQSNVGVYARYISSYDMHPTARAAGSCCGISGFPSDLRFDAHFTQTFLDERASVTLSVVNITNESVPPQPYQQGYDSQVYDILPRQYGVSMRYRF